MLTAGLLIIAIVVEVIATLSLRASEGFTKKLWIIPVAVGYLASFGLLFVVLDRGMAIGVTYGIWTASGVALTAVAGRLLFKDPLTWLMTAGIALVMGGVLCVELGAVH